MENLTLQQASENTLQEYECLLAKISSLISRDFLHASHFDTAETILKLAKAELQKIEDELLKRDEE